MATYPSTLPRPVLAGYGVTPIDQTVRTDMEVGAARVRRRTTQRNDQVRAKCVYTDAQLAVFRAWFDDASTGAAGGANWFTMSLKLGNGGDTSGDTRIKGAPEFALIDQGIWQVSFDLETR